MTVWLLIQSGKDLIKIIHQNCSEENYALLKYQQSLFSTIFSIAERGKAQPFDFKLLINYALNIVS